MTERDVELADVELPPEHPVSPEMDLDSRQCSSPRVTMVSLILACLTQGMRNPSISSSRLNRWFDPIRSGCMRGDRRDDINIMTPRDDGWARSR